MPSSMTVQEVFDNWSAYLRDVDRDDFKAQLALLVSSERGDNLAARILDRLERELGSNHAEVLAFAQEVPSCGLYYKFPNAAPQGKVTPDSDFRTLKNGSSDQAGNPAVAAPDSESLKAAVRWLSRTYASQAHIGTEYEEVIASVLRE